MKSIFHIFSLLSVILSTLLINGIAAVQNHNPLPGISAISESDICNSAIAFVNTTSSPGLEGATLNVDNGERNSDQIRSSLGFNSEITLQDYTFNAYWGLGLVGGSLDDKILLTADNGRPIILDLKRDIISAQGNRWRHHYKC